MDRTVVEKKDITHKLTGERYEIGNLPLKRLGKIAQMCRKNQVTYFQVKDDMDNHDMVFFDCIIVLPPDKISEFMDNLTELLGGIVE